MRFFTEEIEIAEAQVLKIVMRSPILLSYGIESMFGKASYLKEGLQLDKADVRTDDACAFPGVIALCDTCPRYHSAYGYCTIPVRWKALGLQDDVLTAIALLPAQYHVSRCQV